MYIRNSVFVAYSVAAALFSADGLATPLIHSHTQHTLELKPIPFSFQVAASTFLPEWVDKLSLYSSSDLDFSETAEQNRLFTNCVLKGYNRTSCNTEAIPTDFCPLSNLYFKNCISSAKLCTDDGFVLSCEAGYLKDPVTICPHNPSYSKCLANPCTGFDYSLSEASTPGYLVGAKCLSGEVEKYQRSEAACPGFGFDATNCGEGSQCRKLEGLSCLSGTVTKYAECNPCPVPTCSLPSVNIETYYCGGALKCLVP